MVQDHEKSLFTWAEAWGTPYYHPRGSHLLPPPLCIFQTHVIIGRIVAFNRKDWPGYPTVQYNGIFEWLCRSYGASSFLTQDGFANYCEHDKLRQYIDST